MSFQSREKKRRAHAAISSAQSNRNAQTEMRWFLTVATRDCCCACCGSVIRRDRDVVFRFRPKECRCVSCADRDEISYRPSIRWEKKTIRGRESEASAARM